MRIYERIEDATVDPFRRVTLRGVGFIFFAVGVACVLHSVFVRIPERREPIRNAEVGLADGLGCDDLFGGRYRLIVDGEFYSCSGADFTCATEKNVPVVYNRFDPQHCRRADRVGRLSVREWFVILTIGPAAIGLGLGLMLFEKGTRLTSRRLIARAALTLSGMLFVLTLLWSIPQGGDKLKLGGVRASRQYKLF